MSGVRGHDGKRITYTVAYLLKCSASSVPQAMQVCKYSDKESSNVAKQMAVCQAWKAALKKKKKSPSPCYPWRVCVPNQSQQEHPIQNPHHTSIHPDNSWK
jgi:hypothetical protein